MDPGGFRIVCADLVSFMSAYPGFDSDMEMLFFGLDLEADGITVIDGTGRTALELNWSKAESWPLEEGRVMSLVWPSLPLDDPASWILCPLFGTPGQPNPGWPFTLPGAPCGMPSSWMTSPLPGSPGAPNPGWPFTGGLSHMNPIYPNPSDGGISFGYDLLGLPAEVLLYDISGRLISRLGFLESAEGVFSSEFPEGMEPGVYFAVIRSRNSMVSRKVIFLR